MKQSPVGKVGAQMSAAEPQPLCCWECTRGKILRLPCGLGEYVDCPPSNWRGHACATRLLDTFEKPFRAYPGAMLREGSSEGKD